MQTKLTLRLDQQLVKKAKEHARRAGRSVSQLVSDYFSLLGRRAKATSSLTPRVAALKGCLKGRNIGVKDYKRHLEAKYR